MYVCPPPPCINFRFTLETAVNPKAHNWLKCLSLENGAGVQQLKIKIKIKNKVKQKKKIRVLQSR